MKDCLTPSGLGWKYSYSLREEDDETIFTYSDRHMRWCVIQGIKRGSVCAFI